MPVITCHRSLHLVSQSRHTINEQILGSDRSPSILAHAFGAITAQPLVARYERPIPSNQSYRGAQRSSKVVIPRRHQLGFGRLDGEPGIHNHCRCLFSRVVVIDLGLSVVGHRPTASPGTPYDSKLEIAALARCHALPPKISKLLTHTNVGSPYS
jgi:hypothetical protein